jgi:lipoprotein signal peptidase
VASELGTGMAMGLLKWAVGILVFLLFVVVVLGAAWIVREHDKRAKYYKRQLEICWRDK